MKDANVFEEEVFLKFSQGDHGAFRTVFDYYSPVIFRYIFSKCKCIEDTEELTQEAFIQLYLHRDSVRSADNIYPYLFVIAKRLTISNFRKKISIANTVETAQHDWSFVTTETEEKLDMAELSAILEMIVDSMPPQQGMVYRLAKIEDMSHKEIADRMGISKNTVRNHLAIASKMVRIKLENIYFILFLIKFLF